MLHACLSPLRLAPMQIVNDGASRPPQPAPRELAYTKYSADRRASRRRQQARSDETDQAILRCWLAAAHHFVSDPEQSGTSLDRLTVAPSRELPQRHSATFNTALRKGSFDHSVGTTSGPKGTGLLVVRARNSATK